MSPLVAALVGLALPALRLVPSLWLAARAVAPMRVGLLVALGLALVPGVHPGGAPVALDGWLVVAALRELTAGAALAAVLGAPLVAASVAGAWVDRPWARGDGPWARSFPLIGAVTLLSSGAHRGALRALAASYEAFPPSSRAWPTPAPGGAALRAVASALSAAATLAASVLLAALALELTVALAGRVAEPWGRAELRAPAAEVASLAAVAVSLGAVTGALRAVAAVALEAASPG